MLRMIELRQMKLLWTIKYCINPKVPHCVIISDFWALGITCTRVFQSQEGEHVQQLCSVGTAMNRLLSQQKIWWCLWKFWHHSTYILPYVHVRKTLAYWETKGKWCVLSYIAHGEGGRHDFDSSCSNKQLCDNMDKLVKFSAIRFSICKNIWN